MKVTRTKFIADSCVRDGVGGGGNGGEGTGSGGKLEREIGTENDQTCTGSPLLLSKSL